MREFKRTRKKKRKGKREREREEEEEEEEDKEKDNEFRKNVLLSFLGPRISSGKKSCNCEPCEQTY